MEAGVAAAAAAAADLNSAKATGHARTHRAFHSSVKSRSRSPLPSHHFPCCKHTHPPKGAVTSTGLGAWHATNATPPSQVEVVGLEAVPEAKVVVMVKGAGEVAGGTIAVQRTTRAARIQGIGLATTNSHLHTHLAEGTIATGPIELWLKAPSLNPTHVSSRLLAMHANVIDYSWNEMAGIKVTKFVLGVIKA